MDPDSVASDYVSSYKYLDFSFDEFLTLETGIGCLADPNSDLYDLLIK